MVQQVTVTDMTPLQQNLEATEGTMSWKKNVSTSAYLYCSDHVETGAVDTLPSFPPNTMKYQTRVGIPVLR
jgi:hypothetical protein